VVLELPSVSTPTLLTFRMHPGPADSLLMDIYRFYQVAVFKSWTLGTLQLGTSACLTLRGSFFELLC
jgi:hypothetical protein